MNDFICQQVKDLFGVDYKANEHLKNVEIWKEWYKGYVPSFHQYKIYNGKNEVSRKKMKLNMAKTIAESWANLLLNEKTNVTIENDKDLEILNSIFDDPRNKFWTLANQGVEKAFALGGGAFVASVIDLSIVEETGKIAKRDGQIRIEFINADNIYPLKW